MHKILLVEDDYNLGFVIEDNLTLKGYQVTRCMNGDEGVKAFHLDNYDLCLLDVMLPKKDGFTLAKEIRLSNENIPILFITAKAMQEDKLNGFRTGADDYITKPFNMEELIFRIEVFLKRSNSTLLDDQSFYQLGTYLFNYSNFILKCDGFQKLLTRKEADVLKYFCENRGGVIKREDLLKKVWGDDDYFLGRSMDVFISRLRKYLKHDPNIKIINYHGIGFKLVC